MFIKEANIEDAGPLNILINSAYRGEFSKKGWTTEADILDGLRTDEGALIEMMNDNNSTIFKCTDDKETIIGCVYLQKQTNKLYLGMLTVSPLIQNQGIGKRLLKEAEKYAVEKQCNYIVMTVISIRFELIAWYERHGYMKTGEIRPFHTNSKKFGIPKRHLEFIVLEKQLNESR